METKEAKIHLNTQKVDFLPQMLNLIKKQSPFPDLFYFSCSIMLFAYLNT